MIHSRPTLLALFFTLSLGLSSYGQQEGEAADDAQHDLAEEASERVFAFEQTLMPIVLAERPLTAEQRATINDFFSKLDSIPMKIEALGMLDSRFVYVVPHDMRIPLIEPLLDDPAPVVQAAALDALQYNSQNPVVFSERVIALAGSPAPEVRVAAARVMAHSGSSLYAAPLNKMITDPDATVRRAAIQAWRRWLVTNRLIVLLPMTSDPDPGVAAAAFSSLYFSLPQPTNHLIGEQPDTAFFPWRYCEHIHMHYRSLGPEAQARFVQALGMADVPDAFRAPVLGQDTDDDQ